MQLKKNSWGNISSPNHQSKDLDSKDVAQNTISNHSNGIVYGMGRSYGDVCLNQDGLLWKSKKLNRLISFDEKLGILECESGMTLKSIQDLVIPKGWMLPVSPGTQFVTVGGAIANDIHGKNHHQAGTFGNHITEILLLRSDSDPILCGPNKNKNWFQATIGGIGLTGIIFSCKIQLKKINGSWLEAESIPFQGLDKFFELTKESDSDWEYTAAWIDCLYKKEIRGIFERGKHVRKNKKFKKFQISFPFTPPFSLVNELTISIFNPIYFFLKSFFSGKRTIHYSKFLHPLDNIHNWNRMYGTRGFYQFQCVIPHESSKETLKKMLDLITELKMGSFLAVLKSFSNFKPVGLLSFSEPGITFAMDFPNKGNKTELLFHELEKIVIHSGGKIYLAKDMLMSKESFEASYKSLDSFTTFRDPNISSQMSKRLFGDSIG